MRDLLFTCGAALTALFLLVSAPASAANDASAYIQKLGDEALSTISSKTIPVEKKQQTLEAIFKENVDFEWIAKFVMGRYWKQATEDQKTRYVAAYRDFLTKHYTSRFSEYTSGTFKITGSKDIGKGETLVGMAITSDDPQPILIDYKVRKAPNGFKVFDIIVEGVSLITTQRSEFGSVLNKEGIDSLINKLAAK